MNWNFHSANQWAGQLLRFAWPMLWQSSLLIGLVWALDRGLRRRARAAARYALWLVALLKLVLPPSLAAPTGLGWWLRPASLPAAVRHEARVATFAPERTPAPLPAAPVFVPPPRRLERLSPGTWACLLSGGVSLGLLGWVMARWRWVARAARRGVPGPAWLAGLLEEERRRAGLRGPARLRLTEEAMSPAVCGLIQPVILLPRALLEDLSPDRLRPVLLHELIHLRRGDVWVSWAQALLQILYWWHPLVWMANARIRRAREEAVDDAVVVALREEAESYASTLLAVARLGLPRAMAGLGFVGIMESRSALRRRIERLVNLPAPSRAGLTLTSALCVTAFATFAVPMGEGPGPAEKTPAAATEGAAATPAAIRPMDNVSAEPASTELRGIQALMDKRIRLEQSVMAAQASVDRLGLKIPEGMAGSEAPDPRLTAETLRQINKLLIETQADYVRQAALLKELRALDSEALVQVLPTAAHDSLLASLQEQLTLADQKLLTVAHDYGPNHPEVIKAKSQVADLRLKVARRAEGIMAGLATRLHSVGQVLTNLTQELDKERAILAPRNSPPQPNPGSRTNLTYVGRGRQKIVHKLDLITLEDLGPRRNLPLSEAVKLLNEQALARDPEGRGINFIIESGVNVVADGAAPGVDTYAESAAAGPAGGASIDLSQVGVKIEPPLRGAPLADVLNAIVKTADQPIKYSIEDYGVVFSERRTENVPLYFRTIKLDPEVFEAGLSNAAVAAGLPVAGPYQGISQFFSSLGVEMKPPKALFYKDREGTLLLYATLRDLDIIEWAVGALNTPPQQIAIKTKFIQLPEAEAKAFAAEYASSNSLSFSTVRLTPSQARQRLERWTALADAKIVSQAEIITLSGRQAEVQTRDLMTVVSATNSPGTTSGPRLVTNQVPVGPVLDLIPTVSKDGFAVQLALVATLKEFIGYDDLGSFAFATPGEGNQSTPFVAPPPLPHFRVRQASSTVNLWDGQTVVLGELVSTEILKLKDKVPVLGDIPLLGHLFRSDSSQTNRNYLVVLVTPTLVEPTGNRTHAEDELPFAETSFPPEAKAAAAPDVQKSGRR